MVADHFEGGALLSGALHTLANGVSTRSSYGGEHFVWLKSIARMLATCLLGSGT
jgi:hypothetical protein